MVDEIPRLKILPAQCSRSQASGLGLGLCEGVSPQLHRRRTNVKFCSQTLVGLVRKVRFRVVCLQSQGQLCTGTRCPVS